MGHEIPPASNPDGNDLGVQVTPSSVEIAYMLLYPTAMHVVDGPHATSAKVWKGEVNDVCGVHEAPPSVVVMMSSDGAYGVMPVPTATQSRADWQLTP